MPKPHSEKAGFTWPLIWVAKDIPSTHCFTKGTGERIPASFTWAPLGTGCKTRRLTKMNARKERKNRGNVEKQRRNGHWQVAADWEKVALFRPFVRSSRGSFELGPRRITRFAWTTERAKREPKLSLNDSGSLWSQIKPPHRSPNQRPFWCPLSHCLFSVLGSFCGWQKWTCWRVHFNLLLTCYKTAIL